MLRKFAFPCVISALLLHFGYLLHYVHYTALSACLSVCSIMLVYGHVCIMYIYVSFHVLVLRGNTIIQAYNFFPYVLYVLFAAVYYIVDCLKI